MHELGRGQVASPYAATLIGAEFVRRAAAPRSEVLEAIAAGTLRR